MEFLAGLFATACPPADNNAWLDWWEVAPDAAALEAAFARYAHAFSLDGPGPRFMQDVEDLVSEAEPVERLLIEAPGASTTGRNTDIMVRRNQFTALGRPAAAMALYTFQSWAPAGGAGNRTGLRGGGPNDHPRPARCKADRCSTPSGPTSPKAKPRSRPSCRASFPGSHPQWCPAPAVR